MEEGEDLKSGEVNKEAKGEEGKRKREERKRIRSRKYVTKNEMSCGFHCHRFQRQLFVITNSGQGRKKTSGSRRDIQLLRMTVFSQTTINGRNTDFRRKSFTLDQTRTFQYYYHHLY